MITKNQLQDKVRGAAAVLQMPVILGLDKGMIQANWGRDYLYIDHAYFQRGLANGHFRLVRNAPHLTRIIKHDTDRLGRFGVTLKEYRKNGEHIVVVVPGSWMARTYRKPDIAQEMHDECRKFTDRKIVMKLKGGGMKEACENAWAVICPFSVGGVEAAIEGIPVFSTEECPTWPINAGPLSKIESPELHDRYEWANSLAWATWHVSELKTIDFKTYQCA